MDGGDGETPSPRSSLGNLCSLSDAFSEVCESLPENDQTPGWFGGPPNFQLVSEVETVPSDLPAWLTPHRRPKPFLGAQGLPCYGDAGSPPPPAT